MLVLRLDPWIANAIATINTYVAGGRETFLRERLIQDAVVRNFEIIAEAADRLSPDLRAVSPVPWATHYPIGSNEMRSRMPVAAATRSSVRGRRNRAHSGSRRSARARPRVPQWPPGRPGTAEQVEDIEPGEVLRSARGV
jgi:hypothetical protein